jgi:hypothetical protein
LLRYRFIQRQLGQAQPTDPEKYLADIILIYSRGAQPLITRLEHQASQLRIFKATAITMPLLGLALGIWLMGAVGWQGALFVVVVCLLLALGAAGSFLNQRRFGIASVRRTVATLRQGDSEQREKRV